MKVPQFSTQTNKGELVLGITYDFHYHAVSFRRVSKLDGILLAPFGEVLFRGHPENKQKKHQFYSTHIYLFKMRWFSFDLKCHLVERNESVACDAKKFYGVETPT